MYKAVSDSEKLSKRESYLLYTIDSQCLNKTLYNKVFLYTNFTCFFVVDDFNDTQNSYKVYKCKLDSLVFKLITLQFSRPSYIQCIALYTEICNEAPCENYSTHYCLSFYKYENLLETHFEYIQHNDTNYYLLPSCFQQSSCVSMIF